MSEMISITKNMRAHAVVDVSTEYEIDKKYWNELIKEGMSEDEALDEARSNGEADFIKQISDVIDITQEHESSLHID